MKYLCKCVNVFDLSLGFECIRKYFMYKSNNNLKIHNHYMSFLTNLYFIYQGDSGSPLVCCWGGSYILVGVTSWGSSTCKNYPSVYTDVSTISPWITSTVMALRNHHCTENTNSPVKLYWWTEECDSWYGLIYACTLTDSMRRGHAVTNFPPVNIQPKWFSLYSELWPQTFKDLSGGLS